MDLVRNLGAYCEGEAQREWQSFMTDHEGDANKRDLLEIWRDYSIDKFYYRFHGRGDGMTEPQPPSQPEPNKLQAFVDAIKTRFRTSSAEYLIKLENMVCSIKYHQRIRYHQFTQNLMMQLQ